MSRDSAESWANAIGGLLVSIAAVHAFWPLFGWEIEGQALTVSALFFCLSWVRSRGLRWVFRTLEERI